MVHPQKSFVARIHDLMHAKHARERNMVDPLMSIVARAGGLSLRELAARAGAYGSPQESEAFGNWLATRYRDGEIRIESDDREWLVGLDRGSATDVAARLTQLATGPEAGIIISPTARAWRNRLIANT